MTKKDYFEILGVSKDASEEEIKKAYKKLAKKYHPDVSQEKDAEKKFKEIQEAYSVLGDESKRENYKKFGHNFDGFQQYSGNGYSQHGGFDFEDIFREAGFNADDLFSQFFGGGRRTKQKRRMRGEDITTTITIDFMEAVKGTEKTIKIKRKEQCKKCEGIGGKNLKTCDQCNGHGVVTRTQRTPFGLFQSTVTCNKCQGSGETISEICENCNGRGYEIKEREIKLQVPKGIDNGEYLKIEGGGHAGERNSNKGDLYIMVNVEESKIFKRNNLDIYIELPISITEATLGEKIEVPTLDGKANLKVPAGTQTGTVFKMKGKGIDKNRIQGDEFVKVVVETPTKLNKKQKELMEKLKKELDGKKQRKNFFEKYFG